MKHYIIVILLCITSCAISQPTQINEQWIVTTTEGNKDLCAFLITSLYNNDRSKNPISSSLYFSSSIPGTIIYYPLTQRHYFDGVEAVVLNVRRSNGKVIKMISKSYMESYVFDMKNELHEIWDNKEKVEILLELYTPMGKRKGLIGFVMDFSDRPNYKLRKKL